MLAVSSESQIHVIDLASIQMFENQALTQADLPNISQSTIQVNSVSTIYLLHPSFHSLLRSAYCRV